jgi:carbamoyl-phosphate synthase large subunit
MQRAFEVAERIGYPVVVRPSYVLGGRAMMICHSTTELAAYVQVALEAAARRAPRPSWSTSSCEDADRGRRGRICDGKPVVIGGVMQHIEEAGIHSGDSRACCRRTRCRPPCSATIEAQTKRSASSSASSA